MVERDHASEQVERVVGSVAQRLRTQRGESLREVAQRAGFSANQLHRIERLESSPTEEKIRGLARAYDVPVSVMFGEQQALSAAAAGSRPHDSTALGTFDSPIGLEPASTASRQYSASLEDAIDEIIAEFRLPFGDRELARRLIHEVARASAHATCRFLKEKLDE